MSDHPYGWLSLSPPVLAILLAIFTRQIVFSLVMGIFAGALLMAGGNVLTAAHQTWEIHLWNTLVDPEKLRVFSFTLLMGAMIGVITRSGGMQAMILLIAPWANSRRRGQVTTWLLGLLIFFDDYANTILLGNTLRPICDSLRISREKLAYLVDSTAAPVAGLALVSTWVAVEIDYISTGLAEIDNTDMTGFGLFLESIPYRFYIWATLFLVPLVAIMGRDFGPMLRAERDAAATGTSAGKVRMPDAGAEPPEGARWYHGALPIVLTLALVMYSLYNTGSQGACESHAERAIAAAQPWLDAGATNVITTVSQLHQVAAEGVPATTNLAIANLSDAIRSADVPVPATGDTLRPATLPAAIGLREIVGAANSSLALQHGALVGLLLAMTLPFVQRMLTLPELWEAAAGGARIVLPAIAILWTASAMSRMTTNRSYEGEPTTTPFAFRDHRLYTADYLAGILTSQGPVAGRDGQPPLDTGNKVRGVEPTRSSAVASIPWTVRLLPTIVFLLAATIAFCTGTSWGTMGILVPIVVQTAHTMLTQLAPDGVVSAHDPIFVGSVASVLAGAVFGDHCSPISDTTVLSSQSSGCDHLCHVWTQLPYAMLTAAASILFGTLPVAFGVSAWILLGVQLLALFAFMRFVGETSSPPAGSSL